MKNVADVKSKLFLKSTKVRHFLLRSYPEPKQKAEILNLDLSLSEDSKQLSINGLNNNKDIVLSWFMNMILNKIWRWKRGEICMFPKGTEWMVNHKKRRVVSVLFGLANTNRPPTNGRAFTLTIARRSVIGLIS